VDREETSFEPGARQATANIASDRPKLFWQTRGSWGELLTRLMAQRLSITVQHTSDLITLADKSYWDGYNREIIAPGPSGHCKSKFL